MRNLFLRFGCWLTGYNWQIMSICSEVSAVKVKKYTSALMIISLLWFIIGYSFSARYLRMGPIPALGGGALFTFIIIMVERQIILSSHSAGMYLFRLVLGLIMALIGSVIIDQMIFKEDLDLRKKLVLDVKVNQIYPVRSEELRNQIGELTTEIKSAEAEREALNAYLTKHPTIKMDNSREEFLPDSVGTRRVRVVTERTEVENPRVAEFAQVSERVDNMRLIREEKKNELLQLHASIVEELSENNGFLDELTIMMSILRDSKAALAVWALWFVFLMSLELLILVTKISEKQDEEDDYALRLRVQMENNRFKSYALLMNPHASRISSPDRLSSGAN